MNLQPQPLDELATWISEQEKIDPAEAFIGGRAGIDAVIRKFESLPPPTPLGEQYEEPDGVITEQPIKWWPFRDYGRYSPSLAWHVAWGKNVDDGRLRVALSHQGHLVLWAEPSDRTLQAWVADNGVFCIKTDVSEDEVEFLFCGSDGIEIYRWQRRWRFLTFLGIEADGSGFSFRDDEGTHHTLFPKPEENG